jgi:tetratricopeptide (TPR) repeat protein
MTRLAALLVLLLAPIAHSAENDDALCRLGILRANEGRLASAESLFVEVLSRSRHDARVLNNLGNLELLRGEPETALVWYARAQEFDSLDAGICLNRAIAFSALGRDDESRDEAFAGIRLAGSDDSAAALLGLRRDAPMQTESRGVASNRYNAEQVRAILRVGIGHLPADSTARVTSVRPRTANDRRSAGPRASNSAETDSRLYWKR